MIAATELRDYRPVVRFRDGSAVTLDNLQNGIEAKAEAGGIPVAFRRDQVKSGGLFNKTIEDALIVYHPEHSTDYYKFCIRVASQGNYALVTINDFGTSKQMKKQINSSVSKEYRQSSTSTAEIVGSLIGSGLNAIGKSKAKLDEEMGYYSCMEDVFNQVLGI